LTFQALAMLKSWKRCSRGQRILSMQLADRESASKITAWDLKKVSHRFGLPISAEGSFLGFAKVTQQQVQ
jgi:hypothetical protein